MRYVCEIKLKFCLALRNHKINFGFNWNVTSNMFFFIIITKFTMGNHNVGIFAAQGG